MNVLGHAYVAERRRPADDAFVLGAVLPDLASIAGVRLAVGTSPRAAPASIADGIACHHAADATFHSLAPFRSRVAAMRRDLLDAGLPTGPARAVAHAGYELLLDGTLVGTATEGSYRRALANVTEATGAIAPAHRARWLAFGDWIGARPRPMRYDDVEWVAQRLVDILGRRPRLRVEAAHERTVADVLAHHAGAVTGEAPAVFASTFASPRDG